MIVDQNRYTKSSTGMSFHPPPLFLASLLGEKAPLFGHLEWKRGKGWKLSLAPLAVGNNRLSTGMYACTSLNPLASEYVFSESKVMVHFCISIRRARTTRGCTGCPKARNDGTQTWIDLYPC